MSKLLVSSLILGVVGVANARGPRVAIVAAAADTANEQNEVRFTNVRDMLVADGRFDSVTIISTTQYGGGYTPTLIDLLQYDAILHWTNTSNEDSVGLGNSFADYADAGGGIVVSVFANTSTNVNRYLRGRWLTGQYEIIPSAGAHTEGPVSGTPGTEGYIHMAPPLMPTHPIFQDVTDVRLWWKTTTQGLRWGAHRPTSTAVHPWATKAALWDDGKTAVALHNTLPNRVDLGMHPVSDAVAAAYYDRTSAGGKLIANSLLYSAGIAVDFDLQLGDTVDPMAGPRTITCTVSRAGGGGKTATLTVSGTPGGGTTVYVPRIIGGPVTIEFDGGSYLRKKVGANLIGLNLNVGPVRLTNGDVDNSGEVDAADIDAVIAAFGSTDLGNADVDNSGEVDAADIDTVIENFGATDE